MEAVAPKRMAVLAKRVSVWVMGGIVGLLSLDGTWIEEALIRRWEEEEEEEGTSGLSFVELKRKRDDEEEEDEYDNVVNMEMLMMTMMVDKCLVVE